MQFNTRGMAPVQVRVLREALIEYAARHDPRGGPLERLAPTVQAARERFHQLCAEIACAEDMVRGMEEDLDERGHADIFDGDGV